ncbi:MAG: nucleoside triphosphate pyrophosphohydrolase [Parvularculales bacterium]
MSKNPDKAEKSLRALMDVMAALRHPEEGCAWDLKQDHASIAPYTIEEAYEVAEAIEGGTAEDIRDELGDLLLQVVFQARIAEEAGTFDFAAIADSITAKMIRRHPHIFGEASYRNEAEQREAWEEIKAAERKDKNEGGLLDGIASALPPMTRAVKLQKRAARVGFDWDDPEPVLAKVGEELNEVASELAASPRSDDRLADEIGDLLFAVINLARKSGVDPDAALRRTNGKFTRRFNGVVSRARSEGISMEDAELDQMEAWWTEIKQAEKSR